METEVPKGAEQVVEPTPAATFIKEQLEAQFHQLTKRARDAGLNPIRMLLQAYTKRVEAVLNSVLAGLEDEDEPKKKKRKRK